MNHEHKDKNSTKQQTCWGIVSSSLHHVAFFELQAGMAEEPKTNNAPGKAFTQWLYQRGKHAEAWLKARPGGVKKRP